MAKNSAVIAGIDPGLKGGIAKCGILSLADCSISTYPMPVTNKDVNPGRI